MEADFLKSLPLLILSVLSLVVLVVEAFDRKSGVFAWIMSIAGLAAALFAAITQKIPQGEGFGGMIRFGGSSQYFSALVVCSGLFTVLLAREWLTAAGLKIGEFCLLVIMAVIGMMLLAQAADLMILFLGIELMSISFYILAGFLRAEPAANEASLKYFLLGAFATGFLLYGIALIYGTSGTTSIGQIVGKLPALSGSAIFYTGVALLMVGLAFKIGAVPFHMWVPDVYEGAPTPVTGLMSSGGKVAAVSAFALLFTAGVSAGGEARTAVGVLAAASMIGGNILAVVQSKVKRMLAYSSIAHAGYLLVGVASGGAIATAGILFYLAAYMLVAIGSFAVVALFERDGKRGITYSDFSGLGKERRLIAACMAVFMFSLAGIPPFGGFIGKYYMFLAAVQTGQVWLAVIGVLTSLISVYYYLRVILAMYFEEGESDRAIAPAALPTLFVLTVVVIVTIQLGLFPSTLLDAIQSLI